MNTIASLMRRDGLPLPFASVPKGTSFECNGNVWTKRSSRTAVGIWPANLPAWACFKNHEICHVQ